jgi:NTE family protein
MNFHPRRARPNAAPQRSGVVFALSGGGAHGAAQVGMLQALLAAGIVPDAFVGCSVGALNSAFMASAATLERSCELAEVWSHLNARDVFGSKRQTILNLLSGRDYLLDPSRLRSLIDRFCAVSDLSHLAVPTHVVTTSLIDGKPFWWTAGAARDILAASASLPAIFPPVTLPHPTGGSHKHVDGGVSTPVPVAHAVGLGAKTVYVLDVSNWKECQNRERRSRTPLDVLIRSFDISRYTNLVDPASLAGPGQEVVVLPCPDVSGHGIKDFSQTQQLIAQARSVTTEFLASRAPQPVANVVDHPHRWWQRGMSPSLAS